VRARHPLYSAVFAVNQTFRDASLDTSLEARAARLIEASTFIAFQMISPAGREEGPQPPTSAQSIVVWRRAETALCGTGIYRATWRSLGSALSFHHSSIREVAQNQISVLLLRALTV
jgi:hypothetical protein